MLKKFLTNMWIFFFIKILDSDFFKNILKHVLFFKNFKKIVISYNYPLFIVRGIMNTRQYTILIHPKFVDWLCQSIWSWVLYSNEFTNKYRLGLCYEVAVFCQSRNRNRNSQIKPFSLKFFLIITKLIVRVNKKLPCTESLYYSTIRYTFFFIKLHN